MKVLRAANVYESFLKGESISILMEMPKNLYLIFMMSYCV